MKPRLKKYVELGAIVEGEQEDYVAIRDDARDLSFKGWKLVGDEESTGTGTSSRYRVYLTTGDNFVIEHAELTQWQGCINRYRAKLCKTDEEVFAFMGFGNQAKDVYCALKLDDNEIVD